MIKNIWQLLSLVAIWGASTGAAVALQRPEIFIAALLSTIVFVIAQNCN